MATSARHCGGWGNPPWDPERNEICRNGGCVDSCQDGRRGGQESDVDCGGPDCPPCADGLTCGEGADCEGQFCDRDLVCGAPHFCDDEVHNGRETDVDCGGPHCDRCADGRRCFVYGDCANNFCDRDDDPDEAGVCGLQPSCANGVKDGTETDVDRGGAGCPRCELGEKCNGGADCGFPGLCLDRRWDGSARKFCVECNQDDHCEVLYGDERPDGVRNACRECRRNADCPGGFCIAGLCRQCRTDDDCPAAEPVCDQGHVCQAARDNTCAEDQDFCLDGIQGCNGISACRCHQTSAGVSFCGRGGPQCGVPCNANSDCVGVRGPGAACVRITSSCGCGGSSACGGPCF